MATSGGWKISSNKAGLKTKPPKNQLNSPQNYSILQNCMVTQTFYSNSPIFLHRCICHICDILQLWAHLHFLASAVHNFSLHRTTLLQWTTLHPSEHICTFLHLQCTIFCCMELYCSEQLCTLLNTFALSCSRLQCIAKRCKYAAVARASKHLYK